MHGAAWLNMVKDRSFERFGPRPRLVPIPYRLVGRRWAIPHAPPAPHPYEVPWPMRWGFDAPELQAAWRWRLQTWLALALHLGHTRTHTYT